MMLRHSPEPGIPWQIRAANEDRMKRTLVVASLDKIEQTMGKSVVTGTSAGIR
jgi:hypothetical protein